MNQIAWWDAVVDPVAAQQPPGYFFGGLIGGIGDFLGNVWDSAKTFATNNPLTTAGAVVGGLTGGAKGALKGGALGLAGDTFMSPNSYGSSWFNSNTGRVGDAGSSSLPSLNDATESTQAISGGGLGLGSAGGAPSGASAVSMAPSGGNAGITGSPGLSFGKPGEDAMANAAAYAPRGSTGGGAVSAGLSNSATGALKGVSDWGKANPELASAGITLASTLLSRNSQKKADRYLSDAAARAAAAGAKNDAVSDAANRDAQALSDAAYSNYNPINTATRSYAQAQMTGQRAMDKLDQLGSRGMSPATVAAEKRRAQLQTSLGATTAFNSGFSTGADQQAKALAAAGGLRRGYTTGYDANLNNALQGRAGDDSAAITALLEKTLGQPTRKIMERDVMNAGGVRQ